MNKGGIEGKKKYPKRDKTQYSNKMRFDVVVVLGMHRSGTSALTKGLELFGINLGSNVLGPGPDNTKGYFEDAELVQINDRILAKGCSHWSSIQFLKKEFLTGSALDAERLIARRWLQAKVANGKPVGLKDPRLCRTLPFWEPLFAEARLRVGYVLAIRAPMEIAASLQKRNGFGLSYGVDLWAAYMSDALRNLEGRAWTAAGFSQLLEDPRRELARLAGFLGADWDPASPAVTAYEKEFLDPSLRHHRSAEAFPQEFSSYKTLASKLEFTCGDGKASKEEYLQAAQGVAQELEPISRALKTNNVLLFGEFFDHQVSLELFFALEPGAFTEERKISEKVSLASGARREISLKVTEAARKAPFWRIDPGFHAGKISLHDLKFLDASGRVLWDLAEQREKVFVGGTAAPLPLPNHGLELVSTGNDPLLILPPLPEGVQVASIRLVVVMAPVADGVEALARVQAAQQRTLHQQLESGQAQVAQLEGQLKVKKQEVQDLRSITGEVKKVRVETAKLGDSLAGIKQELEAQKVATSKGVEELGDSLVGLKQELEAQKVATSKGVEELGDSIVGIKQELEAQKVATSKGVKELGDSLVGLKEELIHELRGLVGGLNERQDQLQQRNLAEMDTLRTSLVDRQRESENNLLEVAKYAEQIQDSVIAPSSYLIPAPFSWYSYLYKMLHIKKPSFMGRGKRTEVDSKRLSFWRRLERSIRKRRKRWIDSIGFDRDWYTNKYQDVKNSGTDPFEHYILFGKKENRQKNEKDFLTKNKLPNNNEFANGNKSYRLINDCISKNRIKKNQNHKLPFKPGLIIGIPVYKENESVQQLIKSLENCLEEINNQKVIIVFINDYPEDIPLRQKLQISKHFERVSLFEDNLTNEGFIKTSNKFFELSLSNKCDIVLLNSDTIMFPGAITELIKVAKSDPQIGFVSPRSNNASLCSWPIKSGGISTLNSGEWFKYHQQLSKHFPKLQITPTCCGFCLYIKWSILDDLGGFDEVYGKGYEEENDLILRGNMVGYKAVIANNAFVWHKGSASFEKLDLKVDERKKLNFEIICKKYQNYPEIINSYFKSPSYKAEILLCNTQLNENKNIYIGQDLLGAFNNGTSEIAVNIYKEIQELGNSSFTFITHISNEAAQYHKIKSKRNLLLIQDEKDIPFCRYGIHLSQPFHLKTLEIIFTKCLITSFWMLDTIADDCFYLKSKMLSRMWQYTADFSDKIFGISQSSTEQFAKKFDVDVQKTESILLSCQSKTLAREVPMKMKSEKYFLIFGNHFEHKFIQPTIRLLTENENETKIKVFGIDGISSEKIQFIPSGNLQDIELQDLISGAVCVIYPTTVEGFGLPVRDVPYLGVPIVCRQLPSFVEIKNNLPAAVRGNIYFYNSSSDLLVLIKTKAFLNKSTLKSESLTELSQISWKSQFNKILESLSACDEKNFSELKKRMFYLESIH